MRNLETASSPGSSMGQEMLSGSRNSMAFTAMAAEASSVRGLDLSLLRGAESSTVLIASAFRSSSFRFVNTRKSTVGVPAVPLPPLLLL